MFNQLLDMSYDSYKDDMVELGKKEPEKLDKALSLHYINELLLELLGFTFAYFVKVDLVNEYAPPERQVYDHRKVVSYKKDGANIALL